jgi:hypothetical protein
MGQKLRIAADQAAGNRRSVAADRSLAGESRGCASGAPTLRWADTTLPAKDWLVTVRPKRTAQLWISALRNRHSESGARHLPFALKAFPAEDWASLGRTKWNRRIPTALGATGSRLGLDVWLSLNGPEYGHSLPFTVLAALGFVFELLVVEEQLLTGGEDEVRTTVDALQLLVLEFHARGTPIPVPAPHGERNGERIRLTTCAGDFSAPSMLFPGFGPPCEVFRMDAANKMPTKQQNEVVRGSGPPQGAAARVNQSASLRAFLRLRFLARASFTRFFSPGLR